MIILAAAVLLAGGVLNLAAQQPVGPGRPLRPLVDSVMRSEMARDSSPGAGVVVVAAGRVVLTATYGYADREARRPFSDSTIFPIASVTKLFTATALVQLADDGAIDLHRDVNAYLRTIKVPATYPEGVTPEHLITHSGGFDELRGVRQAPNEAAIQPLDAFLRDRLVRIRPPGVMTAYSSFGMALAGLVVQDVSGMPFETYLSRRIWQPLGMTRTFITVPDRVRPFLAAAYERENGTVQRVDYEWYHTTPASSIWSTLPDMGAFISAHLVQGSAGSSPVLSRRAAGTMHRQQATMHPLVPGWAYGFQIAEANGLRIFEHGGDIRGFSSLLVLVPARQFGFFVVSHGEGTDLRFALRQAILDWLEAPSPPPPPPDAPNQAGGPDAIRRALPRQHRLPHLQRVTAARGGVCRGGQ